MSLTALSAKGFISRELPNLAKMEGDCLRSFQKIMSALVDLNDPNDEKEVVDSLVREFCDLGQPQRIAILDLFLRYLDGGDFQCLGYELNRELVIRVFDTLKFAMGYRLGFRVTDCVAGKWELGEHKDIKNLIEGIKSKIKNVNYEMNRGWAPSLWMTEFVESSSDKLLGDFVGVVDWVANVKLCRNFGHKSLDSIDVRLKCRGIPDSCVEDLLLMTPPQLFYLRGYVEEFRAKKSGINGS